MTVQGVKEKKTDIFKRNVSYKIGNIEGQFIVNKQSTGQSVEVGN